MSQPRPGRTLLKRLFVALSTLLILGLISAGGYLAYQALPAFYSTPSAQKKIVWSQLPQPLIVNPNVRSWTTAESVNDALWTADLVWMGTDGGLVVRDLTSGEAIKFLPEHGLPSAEISTIASDRTGRIWVGTRDSGIASYDGGAWTVYGADSGLPSGRIRAIHSGRDGVVWAATAAGLSRFDGTGWSDVRFSLFDLSSRDVTDVTGVNQFVWASTTEGIYRFDGESWDYFGLNEGVINADVQALTIAPDGSVWAATPSGIGRFAGGRWDRFTVRDGLPDLPATDILAAPDSSVWISFGSGEQMETVRFSSGSGTTVFPVFEGAVNKLVRADSGLWLATAAGLQAQSGETLAGVSEMPGRLTDLIRLKEGVAVAGENGVSRWGADGAWQHLELPWASAMSQTDDGRLALAGRHPADGVVLLDEAGNREPVACKTAGMQLGNLYAVAEAPNGDLWFLGTERVGRFANHRWNYFHDGLPTDYTPRKVVADVNGDVWLGLEEGLFKFDPVKNGWEPIDGRHVQRMTADPAGPLWMILDGQFTHFVDGQFVVVSPPPVSGVSRGFVANEAGVWVSSIEGIAHLPQGSNGSADGWIVFTAADGLSSDDVTTLTVDASGMVWAGYADARLGFSRFANGEWEFVHNIKDPDALNGGHQGLNLPQRDEVMTLGITDQNQVWFGTFLGQIGRVAADELLYEPDDYRLYFNHMTAIEVAHDGTLWFAGWEGRLARLIPSDQNPRGERWLIYDQVLSTANVQDVVVHDGLVWLATDVGVAVIDGDECRMIAHREELDVVAGLVSPDKESIWWATANNGGLQLDLATEKLDWPILHLRGRQYRDVVQAADDSLLFLADYHFTWVEGENQRTVRFNDDVGQAAAVTTSNDLRPWIATDRGVATQTRDGWVLRHTTADGLPSNQVLDVLIGADGSLWVLSESAVTKIGR